MNVKDWHEHQALNDALGLWTPEKLSEFHNALRMVAKEELHYTRQKDKTKPHLYFMEGKWHYRSAWMGFDYINGPSEKRNNAAMLWCWLRNQEILEEKYPKLDLKLMC